MSDQAWLATRVVRLPSSFRPLQKRVAGRAAVSSTLFDAIGEPPSAALWSCAAAGRRAGGIARRFGWGRAPIARVDLVYPPWMESDKPTVDDVAKMTVTQLQGVVTRLGVRARHFHGRKADLADEVREFLRRDDAGEPVGNVDHAFHRMGAVMDELKSAAVDEARPDVLREAVALLAPLLDGGSADFRQGVESCIRVLVDAEIRARIGPR